MWEAVIPTVGQVWRLCGACALIFLVASGLGLWFSVIERVLDRVAEQLDGSQQVAQRPSVLDGEEIASGLAGQGDIYTAMGVQYGASVRRAR